MSAEQGRRRVWAALLAAALGAACGGDAGAEGAAAEQDPPAAERPMPGTPMGGETSGTAEPNDSLPAGPVRRDSLNDAPGSR